MKIQILDSTKPATLHRAVQYLLQGDVVALPTETVYGLAADASNPDALRKIFVAKGRPSDHPLIVHIQGAEELSHWAINIPPVAYQLAETFWPGPLTFVLEKAPWVPSEVTGGQSTIALRAPAHPVMQEILKMSGLGLAAPSANAYKKISPTKAEHVFASLADNIGLIVDGGACKMGIESTIVDLRFSALKILRAGPITASQIAATTGQTVETPKQHDIAISGNKKSHYQPNAKLHLKTSIEIQESLCNTSLRVGIVFYSVNILDALFNRLMESADDFKIPFQQLSSDKSEYARDIYASLHYLDAQGVDVIWVEALPTTEEWLDVQDRLQRASWLGAHH